MANKPGENFPEIKLVNPKQQPERIFSGKSAIAIAVTKVDDQFKLQNSAFVKLVEKYFQIDLSAQFANWPDFAAKAAEVIEIPVSQGSLKRIYLVGIGEAKPEELRKAAVAVGSSLRSGITGKPFNVPLTMRFCAAGESTQLARTRAPLLRFAELIGIPR